MTTRRARAEPTEAKRNAHSSWLPAPTRALLGQRNESASDAELELFLRRSTGSGQAVERSNLASTGWQPVLRLAALELELAAGAAAHLVVSSGASFVFASARSDGARIRLGYWLSVGRSACCRSLVFSGPAATSGQQAAPATAGPKLEAADRASAALAAATTTTRPDETSGQTTLGAAPVAKQRQQWNWFTHVRFMNEPNGARLVRASGSRRRAELHAFSLPMRTAEAVSGFASKQPASQRPVGWLRRETQVGAAGTQAAATLKANWLVGWAELRPAEERARKFRWAEVVGRVRAQQSAAGSHVFHSSRSVSNGWLCATDGRRRPTGTELGRAARVYSNDDDDCVSAGCQHFNVVNEDA